MPMLWYWIFFLGKCVNVVSGHGMGEKHGGLGLSVYVFFAFCVVEWGLIVVCYSFYVITTDAVIF